jgi:hypothetical protein
MAAPAPALDITVYPHIVERILELPPHDAFVRLRGISRAVRDKADTLLSAARLIVYAGEPEEEDLTVTRFEDAE